MKLALLQFDTVSRATEQNLHTIERLMEGVECDMLLLPEMFATGYEIDAKAIAEPEESSKTLAWMKHFAHERGCAVVGTVAIRQRNNFYNRLYFCLPEGEVFHYDKRHLFTFAGEERTFSAGAERIIVEWQGLRILPLVCYDLRFPVWSYLPGKVDVILYSASWAASRIGAWDTLLPARAVENQAWVVGSNRVGYDAEGTLFNGHSAAYNFKGERALSLDERECVEVIEILPERITSFRERFRAWQDADSFVIK